jgi:hypothetical protein
MQFQTLDVLKDGGLLKIILVDWATLDEIHAMGEIENNIEINENLQYYF